jgi:hypothetical protein
MLSAEGAPKFEVNPAVKSGYLAARIVKPIIKQIERPRRMGVQEEGDGPRTDRFGRVTNNG